MEGRGWSPPHVSPGHTMTDTSDVSIETAVGDDAAEILALQRLAYRSEAEIYGDFSIPPLTQTEDGLREDLERLVVLKAVTAEGRIVGSVRARLADGTCHIGRVIVHPECQGRGLGKRLMRAIEESCATAKRYELFTGYRSERNLHLYHSLGYEDFRTEVVSPALSIVFLQKRA
jgi:ribosomal protein S18 acetylase RimI-like enzyme